MKRKGRTILFTSHSLYHIRTFADEAIWLRAGSVERAGDPIDVTNEYCRFLVDTVERDVFFSEGRGARGDATRAPAGDLPRITAVRILRGRAGEESYRVATGEDLAIEVRLRRPNPAERVHVGVAVERSDRVLVFARTTLMDGLSIPDGVDRVRIELPRFPLLQGQYSVYAVLLDEAGIHFIHEVPVPDHLVVENPGREVGVFEAEHRWAFEREGSPSGATADP
jgi:hypothetical protein